jgi:hypothetical protein
MGQKSGYKPRLGFLFRDFSNHINLLPWSDLAPMKRYVRGIVLKLDFLLQRTVSTQHYEEQNSSFLILDCLVLKEFDKDFHG